MGTGVAIYLQLSQQRYCLDRLSQTHYEGMNGHEGSLHRKCRTLCTFISKNAVELLTVQEMKPIQTGDPKEDHHELIHN